MTALRRDRGIAAALLAGAAALAWIYLFAGAGMPAGHGQPGASMPEAWSSGRAALTLIMWWAMMLAMMLPSAAPMVLLFAAFAGKQGDRRPFRAVLLFGTAYAVIWGGFSVAATAAQWMLESSEVSTRGAMALSHPGLAGALLVIAGVYQLTSWKHACLRRCRSPVEFLATHWRPGPAGAFVAGLAHGAFCLGCCWLMMALLFVAGVMSLAAVAALATFALLEKIAPAGHRIGRLTGFCLSAAGALLMIWGM